MNPRPLRCPNCGETTDTIEILALVPVSGHWSAIARGVVDGDLLLSGLDNMTDPIPNRKVTLHGGGFLSGRIGPCEDPWHDELDEGTNGPTPIGPAT